MSAAAAVVLKQNAVCVSAGLVRVEPATFLEILNRCENPLIVYANYWVIFTRCNHHYLLPYKGLAFVTRSIGPLPLPKGAEVIRAKSLFLPV